MTNILASLARISDLDTRPFVVEEIPFSRWETGDYLAAQVLDHQGAWSHVELTCGRMAKVIGGDMMVGALGRRAATLEVVGDWREVGEDLQLDALNSAGVLGRATSVSAALPPLMKLDYVGHVLRDGHKVRMSDFVSPIEPQPLAAPVILVIGTSMDAGKTMTARVLIHRLKQRGLQVAGIKLTGVGRYRDILSMKDAGADCILDFVDAGLPSTICEPELFREAVGYVLARVAASGVDVVVAEAGASPLEPYNCDVCVEAVSSHVRATALCAFDPYSVVGVMHAFGNQPDVVAGRATATSAGRELIEQLTGIPAANVLEPMREGDPLEQLLDRALS